MHPLTHLYVCWNVCRLVEGDIFRIGMHLEDIKEMIDGNVCAQISPPHSSSTPTHTREALHVKPAPLCMPTPSPPPSLHQVIITSLTLTASPALTHLHMFCHSHISLLPLSFLQKFMGSPNFPWNWHFMLKQLTRFNEWELWDTCFMVHTSVTWCCSSVFLLRRSHSTVYTILFWYQIRKKSWARCCVALTKLMLLYNMIKYMHRYWPESTRVTVDWK